MLPEDVARASAAILEGGWGDRRETLTFYTRHPACEPVLAEAHGEIVGTSIATQSGAVGWLGLVFVAPAWRGKGLGSVLTRTSLATLERVGCTTVLLAATELGKPVYERVGFVDDAGGGYTIWRGPAGGVLPPDPRVRVLAPHDLPQVYLIDQRATDEDRAHLIRALPNGWVVCEDGSIRGYALRTPWGFGPVVCDDDDARIGSLLIDVLLAHAEAASVQLVVPTSNDCAARALQRRGFSEQRRLPRLRLGQPVAWQPRRIWAIFNFAVG